jgi:hypothetical protein
MRRPAPRSKQKREASKSRRRTGRPARPRVVAPKPTLPIVPGSLPEGEPVELRGTEPPHAHAVCRSCGRISDVTLGPEDVRHLNALALRGPRGWSVEGVTVSLTGACRQCREGLSG